jgi:hypothetical protein
VLLNYATANYQSKVKKEDAAVKIRVILARDQLRSMRAAFNMWYCNDSKVVAKYAHMKGMKMISERQKSMVH